MRPRIRPSASTTYQDRVISDALGVYVRTADSLSDGFARTERSERERDSLRVGSDRRQYAEARLPQYITSHSTKPSGGAISPARRRSCDARIPWISPGVIRPCPTATMVPTIDRTI